MIFVTLIRHLQTYLYSGYLANRLASKPVMYFWAAWTFSGPEYKGSIENMNEIYRKIKHWKKLFTQDFSNSICTTFHYPMPLMGSQFPPKRDLGGNIIILITFSQLKGVQRTAFCSKPHRCTSILQTLRQCRTKNWSMTQKGCRVCLQNNLSHMNTCKIQVRKNIYPGISVHC